VYDAQKTERIRRGTQSGPDDRVPGRRGDALPVDHPAHAEVAESILRRMERPHGLYGWQEIARFAKSP
jgi:hypothetical protein